MTLLNVKPANGYDSLLDQVFNGFPGINDRFGADKLRVPATNIYETPDNFELELNVPGRNKEDFKIAIDRNLLTVSFEQGKNVTNEGVKTVRREFSFDSFKRTFTLGNSVDVNNIQAKYENGLLKISLGKKEEVKPSVKEISIS
jgi:HSP20 family protein